MCGLLFFEIVAIMYLVVLAEDTAMKKVIKTATDHLDKDLLIAFADGLKQAEIDTHARLAGVSEEEIAFRREGGWKYFVWNLRWRWRHLRSGFFKCFLRGPEPLSYYMQMYKARELAGMMTPREWLRDYNKRHGITIETTFEDRSIMSADEQRKLLEKDAAELQENGPSSTIE